MFWTARSFIFATTALRTFMPPTSVAGIEINRTGKAVGDCFAVMIIAIGLKTMRKNFIASSGTA